MSKELQFASVSFQVFACSESEALLVGLGAGFIRPAMITSMASHINNFDLNPTLMLRAQYGAIVSLHCLRQLSSTWQVQRPVRLNLT